LILTRQWRDDAEGQSLIFWLATEKGPARVQISQTESVFFIAENDRHRVVKCLDGLVNWRYSEVDLKCLRSGEPCLACYFSCQRDLGFARRLLERRDISVFEADLRPTDRYLMERFIRGVAEVVGPAEEKSGYVEFINPRMRPAKQDLALKIVSLDIETSVTTKTLLSIAVHGLGRDRVFMVGEERKSEFDFLEWAPNEESLIIRFLEWFTFLDPDVVVGWAVVGFDLKYLQERCDALNISFTLGRNNSQISWRVVEKGAQRLFAVVPGRVVLDGIEMLKTATYSFRNFSLENVSRELLGRGKLIHDVDARAIEIEELHRNDPYALARYNLEDCKLVMEIFEKTKLIDFAVKRSCLTGLELDRQGGSVAAFDFLYLPQLHRKGFVAPIVDPQSVVNSPGGYVLESTAGIFDDVVVFDFKSLYPSIIRTFHVDPLAMMADDEFRIPGFLGASFSKRKHVLPEIIEHLWQARDVAKKEGDQAGSRAIKILMNSFYGVMGTPGCRFFDPRLASSITRRGHEILCRTRDLVEENGYTVIYGDTDSLFVHMAAEAEQVASVAAQLVESLNDWWSQELACSFGIESFLELEFETHFERFFMPSIRGSLKGSKKRYAGLVSDANGDRRVVFKGLESVRSDWSTLAKEFQRTLYHKIFHEEPVADFIRDIVKRVLSGELDEKLTLRRRMRRKVADYRKNIPPHVKAAKMVDEERSRRGLKPIYEEGGWIEYRMTINGPEPIQYSASLIDYNFYIESQLAPIADAILGFRQTSLAELTDQQLNLF